MQAHLADLLPRLNERDRRLALATEAKSWGRGGIAAVHQATGASRTTIRRGMTELADNSGLFAVSSGLLRVRWGQVMYAGLGLVRVGRGAWRR
jgi:hypothetical protein